MSFTCGEHGWRHGQSRCPVCVQTAAIDIGAVKQAVLGKPAEENRMTDIPRFWIRKSTGQRVRVLDVVEGWVVARVKGCAPFLYSLREFKMNFEPVSEGESE